MDAKEMLPFCSKDENRSHIQKPVSRGEFTYATNGHIMLRVPRLSNVSEDAEAPNFEAVIGKVDKATTLVPIPSALPKVEMIECDDCDHEGDSVHDCPDCECVCETCDGKHWFEPRTSVSINGAHFDLKYIRQIAALPHVRFQVETSKDGPNYFEFDGGIGCVMPLRSTFSNHLGELSALPEMAD